MDEPNLVRFRCHTGHAYYGESLFAEQAEHLEAALWTAVRTFRERTVLARQLAHERRRQGDPEAAERFEQQADVAERYGNLIQQYLLGGAPEPGKASAG